MKKILITGSEGLIGNSLRHTLMSNGYDFIGLDIKPCTYAGKGIQGNILDFEVLKKAASSCDGIIHLAAVSRVIDGQRNPELCQEVNVTGTANIIKAAQKSKKNPWIIYASSREVYGDAKTLPVHEDCALMPVNIYGRTKVEAESLIYEHFSSNDATGGILRFSNVYGDPLHDYIDRVVPAFAHAAVTGKNLRVDGKQNSFDFTYVQDTVEGIFKTVRAIETSLRPLLPIHLLTGRETTLERLAQLACEYGIGKSDIIEAPSRHYDVANFYGNPQRAKVILGWEPTVYIEEGLRMLINDFQSLRKRA